MHSYNATLVHWHHTLGCQCSSFGTYDVHKVVPVKVLIAEKCNYFMTSLRGKNEVEVKFEKSMHNYNATLVHWHQTLGCQCSSIGTYDVHKVVPIRLLIAEKFNYFTTSLRGKNKVEVKFENSMHNYSATLVHWHHTLGCQWSSFGTYDVHKVVPVRLLIAEKLNYFMTSLRGKNEVEVKFENSMHNYNATLVHWHQTLGCQCSSIGTYDVHKVVPIRLLIAEKFNYFTTSLGGKNKVEVKFENSMHNYNATLVHWHHTLGCQCSSFGTYDVHKVVPVRLLIAEKLNYFMTSLRGKNEFEVKFENSMHNYNATLVHWHHTLGCQCSSFDTYAVHKVVPVRILIAKKLNYFTTSLRGKNKVEVKFKNSMHNYNATQVHWHQTLGCQCISFGTYDVHKVVPVKVLIAEKLNYFMTSLRGKNEVEAKFENSMHNYNATLVHWHHTLGCQCSSFDTYAVHKVVPVRVFIAKKLNYFTTSLRGKNKVEVKFENSMHNYNASLVHWHHTFGCQCSSFGTYAVHKVGPVKQSKTLLTDGRTDGQTDGRTDGQTDRRTDGNHQSNSRVGYTQPA